MATPSLYYQDASVHVIHGDSLEALREYGDASIDAVVTDPPYSLSFMGREWDSHETPAGFQAWCQLWATECLRVLKPGGHMLAFGGTRTWHRLACAVEDAGFEVRDSIAWMYGSGFPKSLDVSKAIDKAADYRLQAAVRRAAVAAVETAGLTLPGNSRHDWTVGEHAPGDKWWAEFQQWLPDLTDKDRERVEGEIVATIRKTAGWFTRGDIYDITAPATPNAERWQGWGTALKPAHEPIVVARKPLAGTVAANVLAHGTGALNVDGCRVGDNPGYSYPNGPGGQNLYLLGGYMTVEDLRVAAERDEVTPDGRHRAAAVWERFKSGQNRAVESTAGRWPANVILDESQAEALDLMSGETQSKRSAGRNGQNVQGVTGIMAPRSDDQERGHDDLGGASRFMYVAKADASERPFIFRPTCECEDAWPTTSAARATAATARPCGSSTSKSGRPTTDAQSPRATRSTTSTETSSTTTPATSSPSPRPITSASTRAASSATGSGGSPAGSAASSSPSDLATGTSAARDGRSTDAAAPATSRGWSATSVCGNCGAPTRREAHATVKPLALMRWLVRLATPPGGTVLEPFAGSGTTVEACILEGFQCVAIEREADYLPLIVQRINRRRDPVAAVRDSGDDGGLFDLLNEETA